MQRNPDNSVHVSNLDDKVNEQLLWELFIQIAPVKSVYMPRDRQTKIHHNYGFVEFFSSDEAEYSVNIMNLIKLYNKPLRVVRAAGKGAVGVVKTDVGANLFISHLAYGVDEKELQQVFGAFGKIIQPPKISRDESGQSRGFGFVSFDGFDAADLAIAAMDGQWLLNQQIKVQYAFKKDSRERHGSQAERLLAAASAQK